MLSKLFAENYKKLLEISKNISPSNYEDLLHDTFIAIEEKNISLNSQTDFIRYTTACLHHANRWARIKHKERNLIEYTNHTYTFIDSIEPALILNSAENYSEYIKERFDDYILNDLPFQNELKNYPKIIKYAEEHFSFFELFVFKCYYIEYLRQNQIFEIARQNKMKILNKHTKEFNVITKGIIRETIKEINFKLRFVYGKSFNTGKAKR